MNEQNIFEMASRKKLRFPTKVGLLSVEQLWDVPLKDTDSILSLDHIAVVIYKRIQDFDKEKISFVDDPGKLSVKDSVEYNELSLALDIVKRVIAVKSEELKIRQEANKNAELRKEILKALKVKDNEELTGKSRAELVKMLGKLK